MRRLSWAMLAWSLPFALTACLPGRGQPNPSPSASASQPAAAPAIATAAPTSAPAATPTPGTVYTVKAGDSLSAIAATNKTSVDAIVKANNLSDPDKIQEGQKLVMPAEAAAPASSTGSAAPAVSGAASALPPAASKPPPP
jgi:N-acetylmuramoyl-L-alanine amidase